MTEEVLNARSSLGTEPRVEEGDSAFPFCIQLENVEYISQRYQVTGQQFLQLAVGLGREHSEFGWNCHALGLSEKLTLNQSEQPLSHIGIEQFWKLIGEDLEIFQECRHG